ncbi:hypothetical protein SAMN05216570_0136 [Dyella sp. OK004]|uniref:hypothetical protein n=1 Tax=Dyella sp. OK004 TaxID=1855292 RepID=UPI0008E46658|nr:hypothetical protein [Dyella sp. OK004]SFR86780.1 hypothetical protein SAMN05216570_0136 [Dyella sp. OK004]
MRYGHVVDALGLAIICINLMTWRVARQLRGVDPGYFKTRDGSLHWWDIGSWFCLTGMLFDRRLPASKHGREMRRRIIVIRVLNAFAMGAGLIFLWVTFTHPELIFGQ